MPARHWPVSHWLNHWALAYLPTVVLGMPVDRAI